MTSDPPRPRCRYPQHNPRNDCGICRQAARQLTGDEYDDAWFGTGELRVTAYPASHRGIDDTPKEGQR